jgi:hypothetical protein
MHCQLQWRTSCHGKPTIEIRKLLLHDKQNCLLSLCDHMELTCHVCLDEACDMFHHHLQYSSNCILELFTRLINCHVLMGTWKLELQVPKRQVYNKRDLGGTIHVTSLHCVYSPSPFSMFGPSSSLPTLQIWLTTIDL